MKAALVGPAWQAVTHFPLFAQVSEAAMAAVPELSSEMMAYYRSVGRLRPVTGAGCPFHQRSAARAWRPDWSPKLQHSMASGVPSLPGLHADFA